MATAAPPIQSSQPSSLLRVLYTIQGEEENDSDDSASSSSASFPNCFLMDRPPSGLLKAHDVLARFPPAAAAAEVGGVGRMWVCCVFWGGYLCGV